MEKDKDDDEEEEEEFSVTNPVCPLIFNAFLLLLLLQLHLGFDCTIVYIRLKYTFSS